MSEQLFQVVCALCPCSFICAKLDDDELICELCGHSLDDDHTGSVIEQAEVI
jgi:hypothetical protein